LKLRKLKAAQNIARVVSWLNLMFLIVKTKCSSV
jgi:hypothetical protein